MRPSRLLLVPVLVVTALIGPAAGTAQAFPAADSGYHTYEELTAAIRAVEAAHPGLVRISSIGRSHEGRELWIAKVSDNVALDENEPEVLLDGGHHGREHLSVEMALATLTHLSSRYASDAAVKRRVDGTETWILFNLNPDGTAYDGGGSTYRDWRKNRQPTPGTSAIGTDLNRNYGWKWGCCGGSSGSPAHENYRGPAAWSAPEVAALKRFVDGRVVNGRQQIRIHLSFHSFGRVVAWPWAHSAAGVPDADDRAALAAIGNEMARLAGYRGMQSHALYPTDGDQIDWMYGAHRIFSYTVELADRRYPPDEMIPTETARAMPAVLYALDQAACPWSVIGRGAVHCPPSWVSRIAGADRYATAAAIARSSFGSGVGVAYVATGANYPDALAAIPLAARTSSPLLLTHLSGAPAATTNELARLAPGRIVVLGGTAAVSEAVIAQLRSYTTGTVSRIAGADRYGTAAAVAGAFAPGRAATFLATGTAYPDALAGGPAAALLDVPLLLVAPDRVPAPTAAQLDRIRPERLVVLGGLAAVRDEVAAAAALAAR